MLSNFCKSSIELMTLFAATDARKVKFEQRQQEKELLTVMDTINSECVMKNIVYQAFKQLRKFFMQCAARQNKISDAIRECRLLRYLQVNFCVIICFSLKTVLKILISKITFNNNSSSFWDLAHRRLL